MIVSCHQPNYLPWLGYFYKLKYSDIFVILDSVQFPNGRSWVTRNRIKTTNGQLWLTIPVKRKGRSSQKIRDVEIDNTYDWQKKHLLSFLHFYKRATYFPDYINTFERIYNENWTSLAELNLAFIKEIAKWLGITTKIIYSSELQLTEKGSELILEICKKLNADTYLSGYGSRKYIVENNFLANNIKIQYYHSDPKPYPQLWGNFMANLSIIDLLLNCGKKGFDTQVIKQK